MRLGRTHRRWVPLLALFAAPLVSLATLAANAAGALPPGAVIAPLSNLHTLTRWAYPSSKAPVHASPSPRSRTIGRLRLLTDDEQAELYVALASARLASGARWIEIEFPARPDGQKGWVPRGALQSFHTVDGYLLVDRTSLRATLFRDGRAIFTAPIGVGKRARSHRRATST